MLNGPSESLVDGQIDLQERLFSCGGEPDGPGQKRRNRRLSLFSRNMRGA
jgi:hypothetical protein